MESIQSFLTSSIVVIWYFASTLIIFEFLMGLPPLMQQASHKCNAQPIQTDMKSSKLTSPEKLHQGLNGISTRPFTNEDETTIQYLEMVGADVEDFTTIAQAREFLDANAPWTIERVPVQTPAAHAEVEKLTFEQVRTEFATLNWILQKHRTGHYRYRVLVNGLYQKFKTLQDALDWLNLSRRLIQVAAK
jgi:hypothetical protein